jgi:hypothetical protein
MGREKSSSGKGAYTADHLLGMAGTEVGQFLSMGSSAVSRAVRRGELILQDNPTIKDSLDKALHKARADS